MASNTLNVIPAWKAAGSFEANNPFDAVVNKDTYYTIESTSTISEMQGRNIDLYTVIFKPAGIAQEDYQSIVDGINSAGGGILTLIAKDGTRVYLPTTYLKSFPLTDGISYERLCLVADLGSVPPTLKTRIDDVLTHVKNYIELHVGIENATVQLGTVPLVGYVTAEQAAVFEATRQTAIANVKNDVLTIADQATKIASQAAYIAQLEAKVIALTNTNTPTP